MPLRPASRISARTDSANSAVATKDAFASHEPDDSTGLAAADDRLFGEAARRHTWASPWEREHDWYHYVTGYKDAADALCAHLATGGRAIKLERPIIFLYRHHLELAVKQLIRDCAALIGRDVPVPQHHRLDDLWRLCVSLLAEETPGSTSSEEVQQTTRLIDQFSRVDPMSETFRYPEDKVGNPSFVEIGQIDLDRVRAVVGKISVLVECISTELSTDE
jgi:hypothetical protein